MISIGIHIGHDGGTALAIDGQIIVAIAEERLARHKHHNGWITSLHYCLHHSGIERNEIDVITISNSGLQLDLSCWKNYFLKWGFSSKTIILNCDHHLSHAIGGLSLSHFDEGLIFVGDAGGNNYDTESAYYYSKNNIEKIYGNEERPKHKSIGTTYEAFTNLLGFSDQQSGKVMGLASYGETIIDIDLFDFSSNDTVYSKLNDSHVWGALEFVKTLESTKNYSNFKNYDSQQVKNLARYIQDSFEKVSITLIKKLLKKSKLPNLILSGGTALNCSANGKIRKEIYPKDLFVSPIASDIGLAIGNAIYGFYYFTSTLSKQVNRSICYGHNYTEDEIIRALKRNPDDVQPSRLRKSKHKFHKSNNVIKETQQMLSEDLIVAWFQGGSESGPRALGNRSILMKSNASNGRDLINKKIKDREWFRPFGPSIIKDDIHNFTNENKISSFMTEAIKVPESSLGIIKNCVHVDNTSRIHVVDNHSNEKYFKLLKSIKKETGIGSILNTSFNIQEPIVETPSDALSTYLGSNIDILIMGDYIISK